MGKRYQVRVRFQEFRYYYGTVDSEEARDRETEKHLDRMDKESRNHIVGSQGEILKKEFKINGVRFKIICTESYGKRTLEAIDTIKNLSTGEKKEMKREKLFNLTRDDKK